jgi:ATP-binding cassette subfamily B protein
VGAGQRIFQILRETSSVVDSPNAEGFDGSHEVIRFENVDFSYPMAPERQVLHQVSFSAERGQVIALVGESGAGKSTVGALLLRLYDVCGGQITIDGRDLRELKQADLRRAIAYVPQDVMVFGQSLRENIVYGRLDATSSCERHEVSILWRAIAG